MRAAEKARVQGGRLLLDIPTTLPDGMELEVEIDDGLTPELANELRRRYDRVRSGGELIDDDVVMAELEAIDAGPDE